MMWYGVLGTKELLHRTYKNLEQRVLLEVRTEPVRKQHLNQQLEVPPTVFKSRCACVCLRVCEQCDGRPIPLPSLQGIAVLNIPSYAGGTNFWGGTKEDDVRTQPWTRLRQVIGDVVTSPVSVSARRSRLRPSMIRSWRWWLCLAACRWPCPGSSTCSTTA